MITKYMLIHFLDDQMTNTTAWNYGLYINWKKPEVYSEDEMR